MPSRKASPNPRPCKECGTIFRPRNNVDSGKYCSRVCLAASQRRRVECICPECGEIFLTVPAAIRAGRKYCSRTCMGAASTKAAIAKYPPREDIVRLYVELEMSDREIADHLGIHFSKVFKARKFYGVPSRPGNGRQRKLGHRPSRPKWGCKAKGEHECRNCGAPAVHLHHIVPRSKSRAGRDDMECNGMALCFRCHRGFHDRRITIFRHRLKPQELAFAIAEAGPVWVENNYPYTPSEVEKRLQAISDGVPVAESWSQVYVTPAAVSMTLDEVFARESADYEPLSRD